MTAVLSPQQTARVCEGIRAALDEWEREARAATPGPWEVARHRLVALGSIMAEFARWGGDVDQPQWQTDATVAFIASHSPDRVLAQIADYRARVDECEATIWAHAHKPHGRWVECNDCEYGADKGCPDASRASAALRRLADLTGVDSGDE